MADKCIGKLYLDLSQVKKDINEVNAFLSNIGANINLEDKLSKKISAALNKLVVEAKKAGEEAKQAIGQIGGAGSDKSVDSIASRMELVTDTVKTYVRHVDEAGKATMQLAQTVKTGMDQAGATIKEFSDAGGTITKRTEEVKRSYEEEIELAYKQAAAQEAAEQKKADAAVQSALKRDETSRQAAEKELQREQDRNAKELAMMDEAVAKQEAALDKQVADYEKAEERKRQASISAEFEREEARKRTLQAEQDQIAKELAMMDEAIAKQEQEFQTQKINEAETAYRNLATAVRNYNAEKKMGNTERQDLWAQEASSQMQVLNNLEEEINKLNVDENTRQRILLYVEQGRTAQAGMTAETGNTSAKTGELESQVKGLVTRYLSLMAVIRAISNIMNNMVEYVSEYSDKMNEIQMITLKTDAEIANLADTYRNLASDMNVSSLDMADAAIYFTRQGLAAEEIEKRLKNVTMYAKAANVEFKDASEIITSVVNSMGLVEEEAEDGRNAAQRVADVFLNIGDHAATSGQEIGEAMQKAAASAGAFGVSMEWLASYIATVSETTRQEARTIGTAFNTIIARLHQIKATGYNQEDETKVNDIAKALKNIDVVLLDQEGNWRDMEDILVEIADKWGDLDGKTKSYIATTMAGVKQQNVFLALMNDMSKGAEDGSRAFELYNLAIDSNGTAAEKYGVYLDSVTAAQERLTIAQENFYSILSQDVIKGWYNSLAGVIDFITDATEAMGGLNIILPLVAGALTLVAVGFTKLTASITAAGSASAYFATVWESHPVLLAITGVVAVITLLTGVVGIFTNSIDSMSESFDKANARISESQENLEKYKKVQDEANDMFTSLGDKAKLSAEDINEYNSTLEDLASVSPLAKHVVDELKAGFIDQKEAAEKLNAELERLEENEKKISMSNLVKRYNNYQDGSMNNRDIAILAEDMQTGYLDIDEQEKRFRNVLATAYGSGRLSKEFTERIKKAISDYMKNDNMSVDDAWNALAGDILYEIFGSFEVPENITQSLVDQVNEEIDYVMSVIGSELNPAEYSAVRKSLADAIFGSDGELDSREYSQFSNNIANWVRDVAVNGTDKIISEISDLDLAKTIASTLFDPEKIGDLFEISEDMEEGFSKGFIDSYKKLVQSGFSQEEIKSIFAEIPQPYWNEAADILKEQMETALKNAFGTDFLGFLTPLIGENGEYFGNAQNSLLWEELDLSTLKSILEMAESGTITIDEVNRLMLEADGDVDKFTASLGNFRREIGFSAEDTEDFGNQIETMSDKVKKVKAGVKDIQAIDAAIKDVQKNGADANLSDIFDLTEAHPELMTVIGDTEELLKMLKQIRSVAGDNQRGLLKSILLGDEKAMAGSKYAESGYNTLGEYRASLTDEAEIASFNAEVEAWLDSLMEANKSYKQLTKDEKEAAKEAKNLATEAAKAFKDNLGEIETIDKVISKLQDNKKIDFSDIINLSSAHPEIVAFANDADKLIEVLQRLKEEAKGTTKDSIKDILYDSEEYFKETEYYNPESNINTMREYITYLHESRVEWHDVAAEVDKAAQDIVDAADSSSSAAETWLEAQMKIAEINDQVNWAKANHFEDQIGQLQTAVDTGGIQAALELYNSWDDAMQQAVGTEYPNFVLMLTQANNKIKEQGDATADLTKETEAFSSALKNASNLNEVKFFKDTAKAIRQLSEGTISASDAYDVYTKDLNKVTKAYEDILDVQAKMAYNAKDINKNNQQAIDAADVSNLASLLDLSTEQILADFPAAIDMFNELTGSAGELTDVLNMLNEAAFIRITGESEADFSNVINGLHAIQADAEDTIAKLIATGQWEVETMNLPQEGLMFNPKTGSWTRFTNSAQATFLKPTSNNPFKGKSTVSQKADTKQRSGRSSGGGGSSSEHNTKKTETEVEHMLDIMSQINAINQAQQNFYQAQQKYYSQTGQIQGVIAYMQKEREELESQKPLLEGNIKQIERYMAQKKAELAALSTSDEAYAEVADDLDKLQKAHQNYTKQLIDNSTAIESLNEQMDEQRKKIRQMEIDLRNTILSAIEDRERKREDMLNAEIEMENTILDLIKKRYEKERDHIIEVTNLKIKSLQEERDLLSEQLQLRKEQEEQEDKVLKLRELEVKYQRIVADPTRAKEAKSIRKEIDDLRKEIAWDTAEQEVKAQQDSIDQQITSLEDYSEYIQEYYEDLFEHPQKLIAEMREIIMMTQSEILEWLKNNDEAYQNSSELTQQKIAKGWENTYNEMKGILKLYWDEVEEIIAGGDEYIIQFLTENSADYAKAGKLQAEAYVDEWKKQLSDLKKAHEQVVANIAAEYEAIAKSTYVAPSGGGGSSGGGPKEDHGYSFTYGGKEYKANGFATREAADAAMKEAVSNIIRVGAGTMAGSSMIGQGIRAVQAGATVFAKGGIADFTGPAWLDGSPQDPERVLSPYQTKLFEAMVEALERASKITIPSMPNYGDIVSNGGNQISVGDIVVNVDNLDTDDDYEELAKKVSAILMERIGRTAVVGGMRINTI